MFDFLFKNKKQITLRTDIHAHLLPGIDDGPKTMEESIAMIRGLSEIGYKRLIATPHIYWSYYPNTRKTILQKLLLVQEAVEQANIPITIDAAAEYHLDDDFERLLKEDNLLTLDRTNFVLVECPLLTKSLKIRDYLFQLQIQGYRPILAHPERYLYYTEKDYVSLIEKGCLFQINLLSILGHYNREVQKRSSFLLKKNWVHFVGTDAHHLQHVHLVKDFLASSKARKLLGGVELLNDRFSAVAK